MKANNFIDNFINSIFIKNERRIITWGVCLWRAYWKFIFLSTFAFFTLTSKEAWYIFWGFMLIMLFYGVIITAMLAVFRLSGISRKSLTDTTRIIAISLYIFYIEPQLYLEYRSQLYDIFGGMARTYDLQIRVILCIIQLTIFVWILERSKIFDMINKGTRWLKVKLTKCICNKHN